MPFSFFIELFISLFFLGVIPTLVRMTVANPVEIGLVRLVVALVLFFGFVKIQKKQIIYTQKNILPCLLMGLFFGLHWILYFLSIKISSVAIAAIGLATCGVFMLLLSHFFFGEKGSLADWLILLLTALGAVLVIPSWQLNNNVTLGFLLGLLNAFFFALTATLQKKYANVIPIYTRTFSQYLFALPVFLILWTQKVFPHLDFNQSDWKLLIFLGIFCTALAHTLWIKVLEQIPVKTSSVLYYISTLVAVICGRIVLNERPNLRMLAGGSLILLGSFISSYLMTKTKNVSI